MRVCECLCVCVCVCVCVRVCTSGETSLIRMHTSLIRMPQIKMASRLTRWTIMQPVHSMSFFTRNSRMSGGGYIEAASGSKGWGEAGAGV